MSVPTAYFGVVLIWATTPLAIKWSSESLGPWLGVGARMLLGVFVSLVMVALLSRRMRWHKAARNTYLAAGLGIWGAMSCAYWGAQYISSGMLSVVFGLSPVVTGIFAAWLLRERVFTLTRSFGMLLGLVGLLVVFGHSLQFAPAQVPGLAAIVLSVALQALSAVSIKRIAARLHPLETTTGALLLALPLFVLNWWIGDAAQLPQQPISMNAVVSVLYLGGVASTLGFTLYFYVLREVPASKVALITLMTPVLALMIGALANSEQVDLMDMLGAGLILLGLAAFQWGDRLSLVKYSSLARRSS